MNTTLDLPDDLVREVALRAEQEGLDLKETVTRLLRIGLSAGPTISVTADEEMLRRRKEITDKFLSGEWGVELSDYEAGVAAERESANELEKRWRT